MSSYAEVYFKEAHEVFNAFGLNGDTVESTDYYALCMRSDGRAISEVEIVDVLRRVDPEDIGYFQYSYAMLVVFRGMKEQVTKEEATTLCRKSWSARISVTQFLHLVQLSGRIMTEDELKEAVAKADPRGSGFVMFPDFVRWFYGI